MSDKVDRTHSGGFAGGLLPATGSRRPCVLTINGGSSSLKFAVFAAARSLRASGSQARVVILTVHGDPDYARAALEAGALGYVVKSRLASELLPALREALAGRSFLSSPLRHERTGPLEP